MMRFAKTLGPMVVSGIFIVAAVGVGCTRKSAEESLPENFGLYYQSDQGLRDIPSGGSLDFVSNSKNLAKSFQSRNPDEIQKAELALFGSCEKADLKPVLIIYDEAVKPQMLHLERADKPSSEVDLGIAPIEKRQSMYKVSPKQDLAPGLYFLLEKYELSNKQLDCFLVNITPEELLKQSKMK